MTEVLGVLLAAVVLARVGPQQVAHRPKSWRLFKPVQLLSKPKNQPVCKSITVRSYTISRHVSYLPDVVEAGDLWGQASVHAQELLVEQGGQGKAVESLHAGVVHALRVLNLACDESIPIKTSLHLYTGADGTSRTVCLTYRSNIGWVVSEGRLLLANFPRLEWMEEEDAECLVR